MKQFVEYVLWEDVRRDMKYPESDNNDGYTYGLNLLDNPPDSTEILDVQWFRTDDERHQFIQDNDLAVYDWD
jgi:hypothetical protein